MLARFLAIVLLGTLAVVAIAAPCIGGGTVRSYQQPYVQSYTYRPATVVAQPTYVAPTVVVKPLFHRKEIVILEAVDTVIDLNAKDVFIFNGPVPAYNGQFAGVLGDGREARVVPVSPVTPPAKGDPDVVSPPDAEDRTVKEPLTKGDGKVATEAGLIASLKVSCASCHQEGVKSSGGISVLNKDGGLAKVDWRLVLPEVTPNKGGVARMPLASSGKPALPADALEAIKVLASGRKLASSSPPREEIKAGLINERLSRVLAASCAKCHGGAESRGGLTFKDLDKVTPTQWAKAYRKVLKGEMPKGGTPLSDEDADLFLDQALSSARGAR
jgi:mono/diheme cytochrome c family protein